MSARVLFFLAVLAASLVAPWAAAQTRDAGADAEAEAGTAAPGDAALSTTDAGSAGDDAAPGNAPLACDGSLCDTTNGGTCDVAGGPGATGTAPPHGTPAAFVAAIGLLALLVARSRRARRAAGPLAVALVTLAVPARATEASASASAPPVDVVVRDAPPPRRVVAVAWNPLPLATIGKLSADVVIAPLAHHALVLSPFWARTTTAPIYAFDDAGNARQLPEQTFTGFGGELGYRYYKNEGGLRGCFAGPSLVGGSFTAKASDGKSTSYAQYGVALDVGYQALVADRVVLGLGLGLQYLATSKSLPDQQFPASVYAGTGLRPRFLLFGGWAF